MTIDRTALRRLLQEYWKPSDTGRIKDSVADLIDELDAKDRRIAELERQLRDTEDTLDVVRKDSIERGQRADDLSLRLSIATEQNANDRKRIAELERLLNIALPSEET